jgi:hypothetical protein
MQHTQEDTLGREGAIAPWILGAVMGLLGLVGLVLASAAEDAVLYGTGLTLFLFGVLFVFGLIHRCVGR